jgi:hypothetical protein
MARIALKELMLELRRKGVGYRENYGGAFEATYPHSSYIFQLHIDRGGTLVVMCDAAGDGEYESIAFAERCEDPEVELVNALSQTLNYINALKHPHEDDG